VDDAVVCWTGAKTKVGVLKGGEATQLGTAAACHTSIQSRVEVLQRCEIAQTGDAAVCHTGTLPEVEVLQLGKAGEITKNENVATPSWELLLSAKQLHQCGSRFCSAVRTLRWAMPLSHFCTKAFQGAAAR
jgi:hypothetical protein